MSLLESLSDARTERGRIEFYKYACAWDVIKSAWEGDKTGNAWAEYYIDKNGKHIFHRAVLAALGRIEDKENILAFARVIAEKKVPTRAAVATIRRWRTGKEPAAVFLQLVVQIEKAVNDYVAAHPSAPPEMIVRALRELADSYEDDGEETALI